MEIQKSQTRTVITLAVGAFSAREIRKQCARSGRACSVVGSQELARLVKPRQRFGYDLVVHVGLSRYLHHRQRQEICAELRTKRGIVLSTGSVSYLCDRFLLYLEALHVSRAPALRAEMKGGYPLHLDATCEKGKGGLLVTMDGWRGWILWSGRIPTEHEDHIRPLIERTVELFGVPVATVRDLGDPGARACAHLREQGIPDFICHYHFLGAVGKKLLEEAYGRLRSLLNLSRMSRELYALLRELRCYLQSDSYVGRFRAGTVRQRFVAVIYWLLHGEGKKDLPFPFGLPHLEFVLRCRRAEERVDKWAPLPRSRVEHRAFSHLRGILRKLEWDKRINKAADELVERNTVFGELREVLRLSNGEFPRADVGARHQQPPELEMLRLQGIENDVKCYKDKLRRRVEHELEPSPSAIILDYLQRYADNLFGHPALMDDDGSILKIVQRTNNVLEHHFGLDKQLLRRRVGRAHLARDFAEQPPQVALVANLRHPDYVRTLCGSIEALPEAMAALDASELGRPIVREQRDGQLRRLVHDLLLPDKPTVEVPVPPEGLILPNYLLSQVISPDCGHHPTSATAV
jgi:hypothetical protein